MAKYTEWLEPDNLLRLESMARDGLTEKQIANNAGVAYSTFREWKNKYPALSAAIKKGKAPADYEVENALYKSAVGHIETVQKVFKLRQPDGSERVELVEEQTYIAPQVTAQIFWLKNRRPDKWRDKPDESQSQGQNELLLSLYDLMKNKQGDNQPEYTTYEEWKAAGRP